MSEGAGGDDGDEGTALAELNRMRSESRRLASERGRPETTGDLLEVVLRHGSGHAHRDLTLHARLTADAVAEVNERVQLDGERREPAFLEVDLLLEFMYEASGKINDDAILGAIARVPESLGSQIMRRTGMRVEEQGRPLRHWFRKGEPIVRVDLPDRMGQALSPTPVPGAPAEFEEQFTGAVQPRIDVPFAVLEKLLPEVAEAWVSQARAEGTATAGYRLKPADDGALKLQLGYGKAGDVLISHTTALLTPTSDGSGVAVDITHGDARSLAALADIGARVRAIYDNPVPQALDVYAGLGL